MIVINGFYSSFFLSFGTLAELEAAEREAEGALDIGCDGLVYHFPTSSGKIQNRKRCSAFFVQLVQS